MADTKAKKAKADYQKVYVMNEQNDAGKYIPTIAKGVTKVDGTVDIRNMPPVTVSSATPFEVGKFYRLTTFNFGGATPTEKIYVDAIKDNWIQIRNVNVPGQPYGGKYWLNTAWVFTSSLANPASKAPTKKAAAKKK